MPSDMEKLTPIFIIYANGTRLAPEVEAAVKRVRVTSRVNAESTFSLTVADPEKKIVDTDDLFVGTQMKILMGFKDAVKEVACYETTGLRAHYATEGGLSLTYKGRCHLQRLNHAKVNRVYNDKAISDIVNELAGKYKLSAEVECESEPKPFILQRCLTDFEFMHNLATENGCYLWANDKKIFFKKQTDAGTEEKILEKGQEKTKKVKPGNKNDASYGGYIR